MTVWTYQLELVPDKAIPQFKRLQHRRANITLQDIFQRGVHPHSTFIEDGALDQSGAHEVMLSALNADVAYVPSLKQYHVGYEIVVSYGYFNHSPDQVEGLLRHLSEKVYFVDELQYEELVKIAVAQLRKNWRHAIAKEMAQAVGGDFAGIRDFLKRKDPSIVLTGYASLNDYDLSQVLSVDDFLTEDSLLIRSGILLQNFRRASSLKSFTDEEGRLRIFSAIKHGTVEWRREQDKQTTLLTYRCEVAGDQVRWRPDLTELPAHRDAARDVANLLGPGTGNYCFTSSMDAMELAARNPGFRLRFPGLHYKQGHAVTEATSKLKTEAIVCYSDTSSLRASDSNERLKNVLRNFGKQVSGKKEELVSRLVQLLVEEYQAREKELNGFFSRCRFMRIGAQPKEVQHFPVLLNHKLRKTLLALYCLRHMRGNVILEGNHVNQSVTLPDLALAFLNGQVNVGGCFVPVA